MISNFTIYLHGLENCINNLPPVNTNPLPGTRITQAVPFPFYGYTDFTCQKRRGRFLRQRDQSSSLCPRHATSIPYCHFQIPFPCSLTRSFPSIPSYWPPKPHHSTPTTLHNATALHIPHSPYSSRKAGYLTFRKCKAVKKVYVHVW